MKYVFRQVPTDQQISPLMMEKDSPFLGCIIPECDNIYWYIPDYLKKAVEILKKEEYFMPEWDHDIWDATSEEKREFIEEWEAIFPPVGKYHYTFQECVHLQILCDYDWMENLSEIFDIIEGYDGIGDHWKRTTIRGCVQGDFAVMVYRTDYVGDFEIRQIEAEYFNTGTEWRDEDGCVFYSRFSPTYEADEVKKDIASQLGYEADEIVLEVFSGWIKTPSYTLA